MGVLLRGRAGGFHIFFLLCALPLLSGCGSSRGSEIRAQGRAFDAFQLITGEDTDEEQARWDQLFKTQHYLYGTRPDSSLASSFSLLPGHGRILVLPLEEGRNAVFLAEKGFNVVGIDFSETAIQKARRLARQERVEVTAINADLNHYDIAPESYDAIVDIDFHRERLLQQIRRGLRKGGVLFYKLDLGGDLGHSVELRHYFKDFKILSYRQELHGSKPFEMIVVRRVN